MSLDAALNSAIARTAQILKSVIATRLGVLPARLEVKVDIQQDPASPDGDLTVRALVNIDGKSPTTAQCAQIDEILRAFGSDLSE